MNDPGLNTLLKWSIENSDATKNSTEDTSTQPRTQLNPELLAQLMGGPSDADRMKDAMAAIYHPEVDLENKLIAWDNFEQLVENLDNANNMENLGLWMPLVGKLEDGEKEVRIFALWCLGTAVQNNIKCQERVSFDFPSIFCWSFYWSWQQANLWIMIGACYQCCSQDLLPLCRGSGSGRSQEGYQGFVEHGEELPTCA